MADKDLIISIEKSIRYISVHVRAHGREILNEYEISPPQFVALQWVGDKEGITIGELSNRMYLAHSTTTDIVDKLENLQLVRRYKSEKDKRLVLVEMEPKGKEIIRKVIDKRISYIRDITAHLDEEQMNMLPELLESVLRESERLTHG